MPKRLDFTFFCVVELLNDFWFGVEALLIAARAATTLGGEGGATELP